MIAMNHEKIARWMILALLIIWNPMSHALPAAALTVKPVQAPAAPSFSMKITTKSSYKVYAYMQALNNKWTTQQFSCLESLWNQESHWNPLAHNRSGASGIPQALPAIKMASAGTNYMTNPKTQIDWGLKYIKSRYSTPCRAWSHELRYGWY